MNKLEKLFGLGTEDSDAQDDTERVDTHISTELLPTDKVGTGAFDPTDVASEDLAMGFDETQVAPESMVHGRPTAKSPRRSVPKSPAMLATNPNPPAVDDRFADYDDDYDEDDEFDQTDVAPIKVGDVNATILGEAIDGRFRLHGILGEGGMGRVYRGEQISIGRPVAIKVIKRDMAGEDLLRKRFLREAKLISAFTHPNVVRLIDFGETGDGRLYLAMEFVNGKPLSELFVGNKVHPKYALEMARQVSSALIEAHTQGVIHRDLKPDNIFLTRIADGTVQFKVLDFGVARTSASTLTAKGAVCGTPAYMAPEQARGKDVDGTTDLYSLGIMLFEALTGQLPFTHPDPFKLMLRQCQAQHPKVRDLAPHVPEDVEEIVDNLLSKDMKKRIPNSAQLADTIEFVMQKHGWGGTIRVPAGPLEETTADWLWTSASAAAAGMLQGSGDSDWLMGNFSGGESSDVSSPLLGPESDSFESIELDFPEPKVPQTPVMLDAVEPPQGMAPSVTPMPTPSPFGPENTAELPDRQPTRMERRMTPVPTSERAAPQQRQRTQSHHGQRRPAKKQKNNSNILLIGVLIGLVLIAGGLGAFVLMKNKGADSGEFITAPAIAQGQAQTVFRTIQDAGWQITQPSGNEHAGIITYSAKAQRADAIVKVTVDEYSTKEDAKVQYNSIISHVYWYDTTVVTATPMNAMASKKDANDVLDSVMIAKPGGQITK